MVMTPEQAASMRQTIFDKMRLSNIASTDVTFTADENRMLLAMVAAAEVAPGMTPADMRDVLRSSLRASAAHLDLAADEEEEADALKAKHFREMAEVFRKASESADPLGAGA